MSLPKDDAATLSARWTEGVLLKRDVFSTVERGRFRDDAGEVDAVLRRLDQVPLVVLPARAPSVRPRASRAGAGARSRRRPEAAVGRPPSAGARLHRRRGAASGQAPRRPRLFPVRQAALRKLHRAGICHNDLAKEQNWLRGSDGRAYVTDFQLAACFKTSSRLFRIAAYEDLRHLLKHKRSYAPRGADADGAQDPCAQIALSPASG